MIKFEDFSEEEKRSYMAAWMEQVIEARLVGDNDNPSMMIRYFLIGETVDDRFHEYVTEPGGDLYEAIRGAIIEVGAEWDD